MKFSMKLRLFCVSCRDFNLIFSLSGEVLLREWERASNNKWRWRRRKMILHNFAPKTVQKWKKSKICQRKGKTESRCCFIVVCHWVTQETETTNYCAVNDMQYATWNMHFSKASNYATSRRKQSEHHCQLVCILSHFRHRHVTNLQDDITRR